MTRFQAVIFDLDNTVYDWYSVFLPAFYAMIEVAAPILKIEEEMLLDEIRSIHVLHRDVEHPFSLLETDAATHLRNQVGMEAAILALDPAFHAFNRERKANLKLFPGVLDVLKRLRSLGISAIAYTDSSYFAARWRIERLGLEDHFDAVYCKERKNSIVSEFLTNNHSKEEYYFELPREESKPNPRALIDIFRQQGLEASKAAYVGDSISKDILMAKQADCFAVWAKYGTFTDESCYARLIRISHWTKEDIAKEIAFKEQSKSVVPDFICHESIKEIEKIL